MSSPAKPLGKRVCVVGAGVVGLLAVKNLIEQGFEVTAFERNDYVGGVWHFSHDPSQTTALPGTEVMTSKYTTCISDFPMAQSVPLFPTAGDFQRYLEELAQHCGLLPSIELSTDVLAVTRDESDSFWLVRVRAKSSGQEATRQFDRVVVASSIVHSPKQQTFRGAEKFKGEMIYSREFKSAAKYVGKRVLVVGAGASGLDTARFLHEAGAAATYLSHRGRITALPRVFGGRPTEHYFTLRRLGILQMKPKWVARLGGLAINAFCQYVRDSAFLWLRRPPLVRGQGSSDHARNRAPVLYKDLRFLRGKGAVQSMHAVAEITGPDSVAFADGRAISGVDAIIVCSGYSHDFSIVKGPGNPSDPRYADDGFDRFKAAPFYRAPTSYARLYQGILSERYPESLALLGPLFILRPYPYQYDLYTMALAGFWSGGFPAPSAAEMKAHIDERYDDAVAVMQHGPLMTAGYTLLEHDIVDWMHEMAGTGVHKMLGYWSWDAWKFWWNDRHFYSMLADGPMLPAFNRYFDTERGRKRWGGARAHIDMVHKELNSDDFKRALAIEEENVAIRGLDRLGGAGPGAKRTTTATETGPESLGGSAGEGFG